MNMISRKIEERNEKIVRGLLKLPPNRRCINCHSLGPQYVCTNFWTFICTTCSGIHREFTHRVKSISMSKFTTQEVEALQNGGNQRARELYLKGWDFQRQRLPDSSNVDRIREFIKNVYVDKKYMTGKNYVVPSTDSQSPEEHEEHRRASSYHSYSQSPPYDYQYEERKYGKRVPVLTRKPGSERSLHEGNVSNFMYSPSRMSDHTKQSRYMNEGSTSRNSSHSEFSGGDPSRSEKMSPSCYSNHGFNSPSAQASTEWKATFMEENTKRDVNMAPHPLRPLSSRSFGSYDGNSVPPYSYSSYSQVHGIPKHDQGAVEHHNDLLAVPSMEKHSSEGSSGGTSDLLAEQVVRQPAASSTADISHLPLTSTSSLSLASTFGANLTAGSFQSSKTSSPPSVDFFDNKFQDLLHVKNLEQATPELTMGKNEGWATFDTLPVSSNHGVPLTNRPYKSDTVGEGSAPFTEKTLYEPLEGDSSSQIHINFAPSGPSLPVPSPWSDSMHHQTFTGATTSQSWNAFEDPNPTRYSQWDSSPQRVEPHLALNMPLQDASQNMNLVVMEGSISNATGVCMSENGPPVPIIYQHTSSGIYPDQQCYTTKCNPFDLPFDLDSDPNKEILNMKSLGAELPSYPVHTAFPDEFIDPWLSQRTMTTSPVSTVQASLPYMLGQSQASQFTDVSPRNTIAHIGGNPFV